MTDSLTSKTSLTSDRSPLDPVPWSGAISGLAAAVAALGVTEFLSGLAENPSIVLMVGERIIALTPGEVSTEAIDRLGKNNKPTLTFALFIGAALLGALAGHLGRRRLWLYPAVVGVGAFVGWSAGWGVESANGVITFVIALVAALVGIAIHLLISIWAARQASPEATPARAESMVDPHHARRQVLTAGGTLVAGGTAMTLGGRWLQGRSTASEGQEVAQRLLAPRVSTPAGSAPGTTVAGAGGSELVGLEASTPGLTPFVVPNDEFYKIDTSLFTPRVDIETWRLRIHGMVDNEIEFSFEDLANMELVERMVTLSCVSNPVGGPLVGNAVWTGIPVTELLDMAGVQEGADQFVSRSVDGWNCGFPTELAYDGRDAFVALTMNGDPLPVDHGFPARMVVAGLYGYVSATKWLSGIELTTWAGFDGYWIPRGWGKEGPVKTQSRIDVPAMGQSVASDELVVAGVAWAPDTGIERVEVSIDEGEWVEADLGDEITNDAWRQWRLDMPGLTPGDHVVQVRATDASGETQTPDLRDVRPDGATGWHAIGFQIA